VSMNRREVLAGLGTLATTGAVASITFPSLMTRSFGSSTAPILPAKDAFEIPTGLTYLNSAYTHPMPVVAMEALREWATFRAQPEVVSQPKKMAVDVKAEFAALIGANKAEISYVTSTSVGENLIVNGLGLDYRNDNVVTDALHFEGAILHLQALQQRFGLDLRIVMPRQWRIDLSDMERVIDKKTKLVEISLVTKHNGFQHDLKAVCDLAHAHGAYVYADIAQAAGNTPIDVRATGVDFCACSSFKWLMGDFGLGFLFVKEELLDRVVGRSQYGYYQAGTLDSHFLPGDPPPPSAKGSPYTWELDRDTAGHFEVGTPAIAVAHVLSKSLPFIRAIGVENILAHRQPLLKHLREELPRLGFEPLTPPESTSAIISFVVKDPATVRGRLEKAKANATVSNRYIRVSPSIFNDLQDVEKLLQALS
jgi:selenocysteine lyase/cysteine desulfurase